MLAALTIVVSILVNVMRRGNISNSLAITRLLWRRGPGQPDPERNKQIGTKRARPSFSQ